MKSRYAGIGKFVIIILIIMIIIAVVNHLVHGMQFLFVGQFVADIVDFLEVVIPGFAIVVDV